jgi:hypothetical protein
MVLNINKFLLSEPGFLGKSYNGFKQHFISAAIQNAIEYLVIERQACGKNCLVLI